MNERPILMSGPMVCATMEDRKWQTRRVIKRQPPAQLYQIGATDEWAPEDPRDHDAPDFNNAIRCPYGTAGDRLWVRETWQINHVLYDTGPIPKTHPVEFGAPVDMLYRADGEFSEQFEIDEGGSVWRPSIFMPRWASRLTLEITSVRVERVQDITPRDVVAEGIYHEPGEWGPDAAYDHLIKAFAYLWNKLNAKRGYGWEINPWVWVVGFKRLP